MRQAPAAESMSAVQPGSALAQGVTVTNEALVVDLVDGRTVTVPLLWYPPFCRDASVTSTMAGVPRAPHALSPVPAP